MTRDHDPRELREAAKWLLNYYLPNGHPHKQLDWIKLGGDECVFRHRDDTAQKLADYILATVREDDGEEQGDVTITQGRWRVRVQRLKSSAWVTIDANGDGLSIPFLTFTRRQFRDLCRGLGIVIE